MHKLLKPAILTVCFIALNLFFFHSAFAAETESSHITETIFFGNVKDDGSGCGVFTILNMVVDIFSIGVGILGAIGITIVGINYLTAGGNEEKTRKAKHRMLEVVIGLVAYVLLYVGAQFLLPGGHFTGNPNCTTISDSELSKIKAEEKKAKEEAEKKAQEEANKKNSNNNSSSSDKSSSGSSKSSNKTWHKAMYNAAKYMEDAAYGTDPDDWKIEDKSRWQTRAHKAAFKKYGNNFESNYKGAKYVGTCVTYPSIALQTFGLIPKNTYIYFSKDGKIYEGKPRAKKAVDALRNNKKVKISYPHKTVKELYKEGRIKEGDIVAYQYTSGTYTGHIMIFRGFNKKGKPIFNTFGHKGMKRRVTHSDSSRDVTMLISINYE